MNTNIKHRSSAWFARLLVLIAITLTISPTANAATSPGLGLADSFVVLSSTYVNTAGGTTLTGDLGYTTGPATAPTLNGNLHVANSTYNQAGIDQGMALAALNSQACTFTFAPGAIDLAIDTTHGPVGVYTPGVYCVDGAMSIGGGGTISLDGAGTYIFRATGALTTSPNSVVQLQNGASACNVWWTPIQASTLGADSIFAGSNIDAAGIAIGNNVTWTGKALAFGGTVSTDADTLSTSLCTAAAAPASPGTPVAASAQPELSPTGMSQIAPAALASTLVGVSGWLVLRRRVS